MRNWPQAGVREVAKALGVTHPVVSRRIAKLKACGLASVTDDGTWDAPKLAQCPPWYARCRPTSGVRPPPTRTSASAEGSSDAYSPFDESNIRCEIPAGSTLCYGGVCDAVKLKQATSYSEMAVEGLPE
jgi:hypothetical protein